MNLLFDIGTFRRAEFIPKSGTGQTFSRIGSVLIWILLCGLVVSGRPANVKPLRHGVESMRDVVLVAKTTVKSVTGNISVVDDATNEHPKVASLGFMKSSPPNPTCTG